MPKHAWSSSRKGSGDFASGDTERAAHLEHVVVADAGNDLPAECLRYETLIALAGGAEVAAYRMRASQVLPGQLASIFTRPEQR